MNSCYEFSLFTLLLVSFVDLSHYNVSHKCHFTQHRLLLSLNWMLSQSCPLEEKFRNVDSFLTFPHSLIRVSLWNKAPHYSSWWGLLPQKVAGPSLKPQPLLSGRRCRRSPRTCWSPPPGTWSPFSSAEKKTWNYKNMQFQPGVVHSFFLNSL